MTLKVVGGIRGKPASFLASESGSTAGPMGHRPPRPSNPCNVGANGRKPHDSTSQILGSSNVFVTSRASAANHRRSRRCAAPRVHRRRESGVGAISEGRPDHRAAAALRRRCFPSMCRQGARTLRRTPSGRSVFSRRTSSGTPSAGASSWIPPESLSTRSASRMRSSKLAMAARLEQRHAATRRRAASHLRRDVRIGVKDELDWTRLAPAARTTAAAIDLSPSPQLSRRWQVTSISGFPRPRAERGGSVGLAASTASIAGVAGDMDFAGHAARRAGSPRRVAVGANSRSASASIAVRYSSSGQGSGGSWVRSPASTCATGTPAVNAGERGAQRARRVALHDQQVRRRRADAAASAAVTARTWRCGSCSPGQSSCSHRKVAEPEIAGIEAGMLAGENERRRQARARRAHGRPAPA